MCLPCHSSCKKCTGPLYSQCVMCKGSLILYPNSDGVCDVNAPSNSIITDNFVK